MNIIVCIKQVPNISAIKFDPVKKTIIREGVPNEISSFDIRALLKAVDLVKEFGGEVVALTMGPPQASKALEQCLALGANRAIHLNDREFAGADTLATARTIALAIKNETFDLIFCGRFSMDAETGQVGPEVAEMLGIPQVTGAGAIAFNADRTAASVERETDDGRETWEVKLPFLLTATEDLAPERFPTKKDREAAKTRVIKAVTRADLSPDASLFGLAGSPTSVKDIVTLEAKRQCTFVENVDRLVAALREEGLGGKWKRPGPKAPTLPDRARTVDRSKAVWVVAETHQGRVRRVSLELLGKAAQLAVQLGGTVDAVMIGSENVKAASVLVAHGAEMVHILEGTDPYRTEPAATSLVTAIQSMKPHSVLFGSTATGRDLAPRVAARLNLGLTSDCIDLEIDASGRLVQFKPAFGGNIVAPILSRTFPQMATVRPGILEPAVPDPKRVIAEAMPLRGADLDSAEIVVGFGMGIGGPENLPILREFAAALQAPLATTRDCCDKGWLPRHHQVGLTGKSIAPRLYFAIGIRGAFEHTVGIRKAGVVVSINNDDQAQMWEASDYGIKGDWKEIVPALTRALQA